METTAAEFREQHQADFEATVGAATGGRVVVRDVRDGSAIVDFSVRPGPPQPATEERG